MSAITPVLAVTFDDSWVRDLTSDAQHTHWLQAPMKAYTILGIVVLALIAVYSWWLARSRSDRAMMAAVAWLGFGTIISVLAAYVLKDIFKEQRPCLTMHVVTVQTCPGVTDYSFPSNHTTIAFALAAGIWLVSRKLGGIALVLAAIEGFSRVYLGQHYPHDVVAGLVLSCVILFGGWPLVRGLMERLVEALEKTPLKVLLTAS